MSSTPAIIFTLAEPSEPKDDTIDGKMDEDMLLNGTFNIGETFNISKSRNSMSSTQDADGCILEATFDKSVTSKVDQNQEEVNFNKDDVNVAYNEPEHHKNKDIEELMTLERFKDVPSPSTCPYNFGEITNTVSDEVIEILDETLESINVSYARPVLNQTINCEEKASEVSFKANISYEYNKTTTDDQLHVSQIIEILDVSEKVDTTFNASINLNNTENIGITNVTNDNDCNKTMEGDKVLNEPTDITYTESKTDLIVLDESSVYGEDSLIQKNDSVDVSSEIEFSFRSGRNIPLNTTRDIGVEGIEHNDVQVTKDEESLRDDNNSSTATVTIEVNEPLNVESEEINRTTDLLEPDKTENEEFLTHQNSENIDSKILESDLNEPIQDNTTTQKGLNVESEEINRTSDLPKPDKTENEEVLTHQISENVDSKTVESDLNEPMQDNATTQKDPAVEENINELKCSDEATSGIQTVPQISISAHSDFNESSSETLFSSVLSPVTEKSDENAASFRVSAIEKRRSMLLENWKTYSPARLDLAAAFENLRINTTTDDETFLSCNQLDFEDDEPMIDNRFETDNDNKVENCNKTEVVQEDIHNTSTQSLNKSNEKLISVDKIPSIVEEVPNVEKKLDETTNQVKAVGRKSVGYTLSALPLPSSPSPFTQNLSYLDNELYKELLTASPSVLEQKLPEFEKYCDLKLEINSIQQNIAKLSLQLKMKEEQIIRLRPQSVKMQPTVKPRREKIEDSEAQERIVALRAEIEQHAKEIAELKKTIDAKNEEIDSERREREEQCGQLQEKLSSKENEVGSLREQNKSLIQTLTDTEDIMAKYVAKLAESEESRKQIENRYKNLHIAFGTVVEKYEKAKEVVLGMKSNEEIYKESLEKLESAYNELKVTHESCKNIPLKEIPEPNKEIQKSKIERGFLRRQTSK